MIPEVLKWRKDRATWLNLLCLFVALFVLVLIVAGVVLSAFVSALFGLAKKN